MTGPKTQQDLIRALQQGRERQTRRRTRKREGYALAGPVDIPTELVWAMVERGILESDDVTWDQEFEGTAEGTPHVDPEVLNRAMCRLLDMVAARPSEFLEFLKDDPL